MIATVATIKEVRIADFCRTGSGGTPSRTVAEYFGGTIPWVKSGELRETIITATEEHLTKAGLENSATKLLPVDTLLVALYGATVGRIGILGIEATTNQAVCHIIPNKGAADVRYLFYALRSKVDYWLNKRVGGGQPNISQGVIKDTFVPLPPLAEQKRIAGILDAADALRAKRREALAQLDSLLQATFLDLFGDPATNPKGWERCTLGDLIHSASDGPHVSPNYAESGFPFLSTRHIRPGEIVWDDLKYIDHAEANAQWKKCKPGRGDILYTKGGTTGIAARVDTDEPFAVWVHVALLKPRTEQVHTVWLESMLNTSYCYTQSQRYTRGIANRDLGLTRMVKIQMYRPPRSLQDRFANFVHSAKAQKAAHRAHLAELDTLFASLQSRAFRGEL